MEATSSSAQNRQLTDWYSRIKNGSIKLPRFQRTEAWDKIRVEAFLETVIHNLPVGVALILNVGNEEKFKSRFISTAEENRGEKVSEHLLDGQQRLTSFWRALNNNYEFETYFVYFPEFDSYYDDQWSDDTTVYCRTRYWKKERKYPLWADSPKQSLLRGSIPIHLFRPESIQSEIDEWVDSATAENKPDSKSEDFAIKIEQFWKAKESLRDRIIKLRETVAHFNLPFLFLPATTPKEIALQVFINMNTNSKPLTIYEIIVAEVENEMKSSLHDLQEALDSKYPRVKEYFSLDFLILATSALLQDKLPNHRGMANMDKSKLIENWPKLESCLGRMAVFMESQGIFDKTRLPTNAVLSVIAATFAQVPESGDKAGQGELLLKKYLWSSFFTYRYENSAASRAYQDYVGLKNVLSGKTKSDGSTFDEVDIPVLNRRLYPLSDKEEIMSVAWPRKATIRARGILAISTLLGALDFADGKKISTENISKREYHHVFPDSLLDEANIDSFLALNCALITGHTNRTIGRKDPLVYLKERYKWADEEIVNARLSSHMIPVKELSVGGYEGLGAEERIEKIVRDFESFIEARAGYVMRAINLLTEGKIITIASLVDQTTELPEAIQNLESQIEGIEVCLRELINEKLRNISQDPFKHLVSENTRRSAKAKIASHLKKFPGDNEEDFRSFRVQLNFFTLGEYRDLIVKKSCWSEFEPIFKSKPNVENRFNQLFTMRNQLAHNNELNDIMIKDGEAAIIWFKSVLKEKKKIE